MKGDNEVIDGLNMLLVGELTAMDQYLVHSKMYEDWDLSKLHERIAHEFDDEKEHAQKLIERILFLEGKPDVTKREGLAIGYTVPDMLQNDLNLEYQVVTNLRKVIALCESKQDFQTRNMLMPLLEETEQDHVYWLEQQLGLIDKVGLENYLQSMM
ncbi:bacterioferritin [Psychrobium sp. 1_MG-2023]|uniref:bacterioferritin n=1 Tax=Psychrobium sp. 1_MG-2023 TaxID=3062624 RepID=UPI000C345B28|nr:bacterioferritin [Psychrobium sp. 1_MG-2023]MDP2559694.1 bacterioferritin [Psychrobium sp. 1_MG-2023]PKF59525.1 bacterioferritin [Alteromonadales bacterium alter-6D02]